jgi:Calcineurin-like phosphoesterase
MSTRLRIAICSDLHVDTWPEHSLDWATLAAAAPADVLLVAGDVHDEQSGTAAELARAAEHYKAVAWVDGNHEAFHFGRCVRSSSDNCSGDPPPLLFRGRCSRHTLLNILTPLYDPSPTAGA